MNSMIFKRLFLLLFAGALLTVTASAQYYSVGVDKPLAQNRPLLALKTNLLYDAALIPNLEVELPINRNYTVLAEYGRGWWSSERDFCWQAQHVGIEFRAYLGVPGDCADTNYEYPDIFRGWFVGLYGSIGYADLQADNTEGIQFDYETYAGVSFGYCQKISKNFRIEYSAGLGLTWYEKDRYDVFDNSVLIRKEKHKQAYSVLPTKAKISLVWIINRR